MGKPIIQYKSQEDLDFSLTEWMTRLGLLSWRVSAKCVPYKDCQRPGVGASLGLNSFLYESGISDILIATLTPEEQKHEPETYCQEYVLVHELLHLKIGEDLNWGNPNSDFFQGVYLRRIHVLIDEMAKALLLAKYPTLPYDWFKNSKRWGGMKYNTENV